MARQKVKPAVKYEPLSAGDDAINDVFDYIFSLIIK